MALVAFATTASGHGPLAQPYGVADGRLTLDVQTVAQDSPTSGTTDGVSRDAPRVASPDTTLAFPLSFRVREWTIDDGLPTPVKAIAQSEDGYLWIATADGLARFDGVRFTLFTAETTPVFRDDDFVGLYAAPWGDLWVGGKDGWTYRRRDGEWTAYPIDTETHWVGGFAEDGDGTLWSISSGPYAFRFRDDRWERLGQDLYRVWPQFAVDPDGSAWTTLHPGDVPNARESTFAGGVVARWNGERFVPAEGWRHQGFRESAGRPLFHRLGETPGTGLPRVEVTDASGRILAWHRMLEDDAIVRLVDRAGRAWVQVEVQNGYELRVVKDGRERGRVLVEDATWFEQVFEDRQGNVWVHAGGIGLIQITEEPFLRLGSAEGVPRLASVVTLSPSGAVVVSARSNAVPEVATVRGRAVTTDTYRMAREAPGAPPEARRGEAVDVGHVLDDARGQRWGSRGSRLLRLRDGRADIVMDRDGEQIWALIPDSANADALWIGGDGGVVRRFDTQALAVTDSFRVQGRVRDLHHTPDGLLWVAADSGLVVRALDRTLRAVAEAVLGDRVAREFADSPDGALWIATESGLARIRGGEARVLGTPHGLPTEDLTTVLLDDVGYVWLSGPRLLYRLRLADAEAVLDGDRDRLDVVTLLPSDGHLGSSPRLIRALRAPDGMLWVPSYKGVTRIDPGLYARQFELPPTVIVEEITTGASGAGGLLASGVTASGGSGGQTFVPAKGLRLPVGARTLTIVYTATDFLAPGGVRFRTRLDGHDAEWVEQGTERRVVYGGLAPGRYTFHAQAMNAGGVWSEPVAAPAFVVPARFYETAWFALIAFLGLVAIVVLGVRARLRVLTDRQRDLEATVEARTADLAAEKEVVAAQAEDLKALDQAKSELFANVSHEFRTPLTLSIGPLSDVLNGRHGEIGDLRPHLDGVLLNNRRLLRMVNQLLDAARLEAHTMERSPEDVDLAAFARDIARTYAPLAERKRVRLKTQLPDGPLAMQADPDHLDKILSNLLSNAFKFTPPGGDIELAVWAEGGDAVVRVRDSGVGIASGDLPHVFERFYRADRAHSTLGSGIGLSLVEQLVSLHGGTVHVESTEGDGATFTVRLSRAGSTETPEAAQTAETVRLSLPSLGPIIGGPPHAGDGGRLPFVYDEDTSGDEDHDQDLTTVLVVDDNADVRAYVRSQLEASYRVREAADGVEALLMARVEIPDLIVSDVMMPEMDGFELLAEMRRDPDLTVVPVILLTARAEHADKLHGLERGADDYLVKPFASDELRARVDGLIRSRRRLRVHYQGDGAPPASGDAAETASGVSVPPEAMAEAVSAEDAPEDVFVARALETARARLSDPDFGVQDWADALGADRSHLYRKIREADGVTPVARLRALRIERAIEMLGAGAGSVSEVAYGAGFNSLSYFGRVFKAETGRTPSEYASGAESR